MGLAPLFASVRFDPKRHEDVSHSKCFAKSSKTSFLLAFTRVFRGLNFGCGGAAPGNPWLTPLWSQAFAAKKLGISRRTLHRKINEMNLATKSAEAADATGGS